MNNTIYNFAAILVMAIVTFGTRLTPFLFFSLRATPRSIDYLGKNLPPAVIAMLIIYSLKDISFVAFPFGGPEIIGFFSVVLLHLWRRNNLVSIIGGTIIYMLLLQKVFVIN